MQVLSENDYKIYMVPAGISHLDSDRGHAFFFLRGTEADLIARCEAMLNTIAEAPEVIIVRRNQDEPVRYSTIRPTLRFG